MGRCHTARVCVLQGKEAPFRRQYNVRVLIPCYKESLAIIQRTVLAAKRADRPPGTRMVIYICDDGNDEKKLNWTQRIDDPEVRRNHPHLLLQLAVLQTPSGCSRSAHPPSACACACAQHRLLLAVCGDELPHLSGHCRGAEVRLQSMHHELFRSGLHWSYAEQGSQHALTFVRPSAGVP